MIISNTHTDAIEFFFDENNQHSQHDHYEDSNPLKIEIFLGITENLLSLHVVGTRSPMTSILIDDTHIYVYIDVIEGFYCFYCVGVGDLLLFSLYVLMY